MANSGTTQASLLTAINANVKEIQDNVNLGPERRASALKEAAIAFRLVVGGQQPGSSIVSK